MKALLTTIIAGAVLALAIPALGQYTPMTKEDQTVATQGAVGGSSTVVNYRGQVNTTVITFAGISLAHANGGARGNSQLIYTFPEGRIYVLGAHLDANVVNTDDFEASDNDHYFVGIGTTASVTNSATLATTEQDIIAVVDIDTAAGVTLTTSVEADMVAGADTVHDGTATPIKLYFNTAVADDQIDDTMTVTPSGVLTVTWVWIGDD